MDEHKTVVGIVKRENGIFLTIADKDVDLEIRVKLDVLKDAHSRIGRVIRAAEREGRFTVVEADKYLFSQI